VLENYSSQPFHNTFPHLPLSTSLLSYNLISYPHQSKSHFLASLQSRAIVSLPTTSSQSSQYIITRAFTIDHPKRFTVKVQVSQTHITIIKVTQRIQLSTTILRSQPLRLQASHQVYFRTHQTKSKERTPLNLPTCLASSNH
jgi:hypothetical protein